MLAAITSSSSTISTLVNRTYLIEGEAGPIQRAESRLHRGRLTRAADAARAPARADRGCEPARRRPGGDSRADACGGRADGRADRRRTLSQRARDRARGRLA